MPNTSHSTNGEKRQGKSKIYIRMTSIETSAKLPITCLAISLAPENQQRNFIGYKFDSSTESTVLHKFGIHSLFRVQNQNAIKDVYRF